MKKSIFKALKQIIVISILVLLIVPQFAFAESGVEEVSISYNGTDNSVTIIADAASYKGAAVIIEISKDEQNTILNITRTNDSGAITHKETIPVDFEGGRYDVTVLTKEKTLSGYFIYPNEESINSALPMISGKESATDLCNALKENADSLAIDMLVFEEIADDVSSIMFAMKPEDDWNTPVEFLNSYNNALAAVYLKKGTAPADVFSKYGAGFDFNVDNYSNLTSQEKPYVDSYLKNADYTSVSVEEAFFEGKAASMVHTSTDWTILVERLADKETAIALDLDKTYLDELYDTEAAYKKFFSELKGDEDITEIRGLFLSVTKACYESEIASGDRIGTLNVSYNENENKVTITGNGASYYGAAAVITISKDEENTLINITRTGNGGSITHNELIPLSFEGGRYEVTVTTKEKTLNGYFIYPSDDSVRNTLPIINAKTSSSELCNALKENADSLAVDMLVFENVADEASVIMFEMRPDGGWRSPSEFLNSYNNALAAVSLNKGTAPAEVFSKYGAGIGIDAEKYNSLTTEKTYVDDYLKNADYTTIFVKDAFYESKAISQVIGAGSWSALLKAITNEENALALDLDKTYFNKLVNADVAYQEFFSELNGNEDITQIRELFLKVTKACYEEENKTVDEPNSSKDFGGGGGGGGISKQPSDSININNPTTEDTGFSDMSNHWAKDAINTLAKSGIIGGFPDGTFKPDESVTRAQFTVMVVRALGIKSEKQCEFTDVSGNSWYMESISAAVNAGIVNGTGDGKFSPDEYIKRQDAFLIIYRAYSELLKSEEKHSFVDGNMISDYAVQAVEALYAADIVKGTDSGELKPLDNTSRAEVATILLRIIEKGEE